MIGTKIHFDRSEDKMIVERVQDVDGILSRNKALANDGDGYSATRELRRVASIPLVIVEKWKNELGIDMFNPDHAPAVKRLLNSPDWLYLRTAPGRI